MEESSARRPAPPSNRLRAAMGRLEEIHRYAGLLGRTFASPSLMAEELLRDNPKGREVRRLVLEFCFHYHAVLSDACSMAEFTLRWLQTSPAWAWAFYTEQPLELALIRHCRCSSIVWFKFLEEIVLQMAHDPALPRPGLITQSLQWRHLVTDLACRPALLSLATALAKHDPHNVHTVLLHDDRFVHTLASHGDLRAVVAFVGALPVELGLVPAIRPIATACLRSATPEAARLAELCVRHGVADAGHFAQDAIDRARRGSSGLLRALLETHPHHVAPLLCLMADEAARADVLAHADESLVEALRDWGLLDEVEGSKEEARAEARADDPTHRVSCPITLRRPRRPVVASDGRVYERSALLRHIVLHGAWSPVTRQPLAPLLFPYFA